MPRCAMRVSPPSSWNRRYLARRLTSTMRWPVSLLAKAGGKGKRMSARRNWTSRIRAPSIAGVRPRRTVSTSGSSGIAGIPDRGEKDRAVFLQLDDADAMNAGQFVEAAGPPLRDFDERPIGENDIGRLLLGRCDRAAQGLERGEELCVRTAGGDGLRDTATARFRVH